MTSGSGQSNHNVDVAWAGPPARRKASALLLALAGLFGGTPACAHRLPWRGIGRPAIDAVILPVVGVRQQDSRCGPAALSTLLGAASDPVPEQQIADIVQRKTDASLSIDLLLYARHRGHAADFERSSIDRLIERLEHGQACLLLLELRSAIGGRGSPLWHYVVAYGFSRSQRVAFVHSGIGSKRMGFDTLARAWQPAAFFLMHLGEPVARSKRDAADQ